MNKYQKILIRASKQALINHYLTIKLKYKDKWLKNGTPIDHPIYLAFEAEFSKTNYRQIRIDMKRNYRTLEELKNFKRIMVEDNALKYFTLYNEDIKYDDR